MSKIWRCAEMIPFGVSVVFALPPQSIWWSVSIPVGASPSKVIQQCKWKLISPGKEMGASLWTRSPTLDHCLCCWKPKKAQDWALARIHRNANKSIIDSLDKIELHCDITFHSICSVFSNIFVPYLLIFGIFTSIILHQYCWIITLITRSEQFLCYHRTECYEVFSSIWLLNQAIERTWGRFGQLHHSSYNVWSCRTFPFYVCFILSKGCRIALQSVLLIPVTCR